MLKGRLLYSRVASDFSVSRLTTPPGAAPVIGHICLVLSVMVSQAYRCDDSPVATDRLKRIAAAIRKRREELGLTQEMVAYESGTSVRSYARIEAGTVNLRVLSLYQIAAVLNTTPSRLLEAADDGPRPTRRVAR